MKGKICPFRGQPCQHPDWADCQFQFAGDEDEYSKLWLAGEEDKMGRNCSWLPQGISRTEMLAALGAFGEKKKAEALESVKRAVMERRKGGCLGESKSVVWLRFASASCGTWAW